MSVSPRRRVIEPDSFSPFIPITQEGAPVYFDRATGITYILGIDRTTGHAIWIQRGTWAYAKYLWGNWTVAKGDAASWEVAKGLVNP